MQLLFIIIVAVPLVTVTALLLFNRLLQLSARAMRLVLIIGGVVQLIGLILAIVDGRSMRRMVTAGIGVVVYSALAWDHHRQARDGSGRVEIGN